MDDEPNIRDILKIFLENEGFEVSTASNGLTALSSIEENKPHIVLLDIRMPEMDGVQCLKVIKEKNPTIEVIMISGFATVQLAKKSLEIGAFDYIAKPLCFHHIKEVINLIKVSKFIDSL